MVVQEIFLEFRDRFKTQGAKYTETHLLYLSTQTVVYNYRKKKGNNERFSCRMNSYQDENYDPSVEDEENDISPLEAICDETAQQALQDLETQIWLEQVFAQNVGKKRAANR